VHFKGVGGDPVFFSSAKGAWLTDVGRQKLYLIISAPGDRLIAGHAHPQVIEAVQQMCVNGLGYGAPTAIGNRDGGFTMWN